MITLHRGDCIEILKTMQENSLDSCVTDPPYNLVSAKAMSSSRVNAASPFGRIQHGFIDTAWGNSDIAFNSDAWREILRVMKPGAHMAVFGGSRTSHRMAVAIEDAGWTIRETAMWLYTKGSMPTGQNLRPMYEPILICRAPLSETSIKANVARWGTGYLQIDQARHGERWPTNILIEDDLLLDERSRLYWSPKAGKLDRAGSLHPTIKPIKLLEYLITLITPKGRTVLDCFAGSGTLATAAHNLGFDCVLIEREDEYIADIERRVRELEDPFGFDI